MKKISLILSLTALTGLAVACGKENLQPLEYLLGVKLNYVDVDARFCTSPRSPGKQKIKYLFIIDHSQSNQPGFPNPLTPTDVIATDPLGSRRYGPMAQFIRDLPADPNNVISFNLVDFNDKAYQPKNVTAFDPDATHFLNAALADWVGTGTQAMPAPADKGFTNYQAALKLAERLIQEDAQSEAVNPARPIVVSSYKLVFVTDGIPTVISASSMTQIYTQDFVNDIQPVIASILSIKNDAALGPYISGIELDTAYYFQDTEIVNAETLLQQMAVAGNGTYFQFGSGKDIAYQNFAPPSRNIKFNLADVWVENLNAVWWTDGSLRASTDTTGMPDDVKMAQNGDITKADSDGNGVTDLVEYMTKRKVCNDSHCQRAAADPYAICAGLSPVTMPDGSVTYPSSSRSGFNDCEAFILGTDLNTFSTNLTFLPDHLAFKNSLPILAGTDGTGADPFADGMTNYTKLKLGLPIAISKSTLLTFKTRKITLTHEDSADFDIDCYHMAVEHVSTVGDNNQIKFYVIQNTAVLDDKPVLKSAVRTVAGQTSLVTFVPEDFN